MAVSSAQTTTEKRKATQTRCMLEKYGASCFVQLLDEEPPPPGSHKEEVKEEELSTVMNQHYQLHSMNYVKARLNYCMKAGSN